VTGDVCGKARRLSRQFYLTPSPLALGIKRARNCAEMDVRNATYEADRGTVNKDFALRRRRIERNGAAYCASLPTPSAARRRQAFQNYLLMIRNLPS
jgi:hypothetical protein